MKVLFYGNEWTSFDNFSSYQLYWRGLDWPTVEHAYQSAKFNDPMIVEKIRKARSAHDAKKIGRSYPDMVRSDWKKIKLGVMEELLRLKLAQHPHVREKLLTTGDSEIVEDSPKDNFWGRGPDWKGENHLGRLWMKLRAEIQDSKTFSARVLDGLMKDSVL